jgi:hypothetical protein
VVVRVDHARNDNMVRGVDHLVGGLRQATGRANGLNAVVSDKDGCVAKFIARVIERGDGVGVVDEQGGHDNDFARRN